MQIRTDTKYLNLDAIRVGLEAWTFFAKPGTMDAQKEEELAGKLQLSPERFHSLLTQLLPDRNILRHSSKGFVQNFPWFRADLPNGPVAVIGVGLEDDRDYSLDEIIAEAQKRSTVNDHQVKQVVLLKNLQYVFIRALRKYIGFEFAKIPVDTIAKSAGIESAIYTRNQLASFTRAGLLERGPKPGLYRFRVQVKVAKIVNKEMGGDPVCDLLDLESGQERFTSVPLGMLIKLANWSTGCAKPASPKQSTARRIETRDHAATPEKITLGGKQARLVICYLVGKHLYSDPSECQQFLVKETGMSRPQTSPHYKSLCDKGVLRREGRIGVFQVYGLAKADFTAHLCNPHEEFILAEGVSLVHGQPYNLSDLAERFLQARDGQ